MAKDIITSGEDWETNRRPQNGETQNEREKRLQKGDPNSNPLGIPKDRAMRKTGDPFTGR